MRNKISKTNNFYYMTFALVGFLVFSSLAQALPSDFGFLEYTLEGLTVLTFLVCLVSLRFGKRWNQFLGLIVVGFISVIAIGSIFSIQEMDIAMLFLMFMFFFGMFKAVSKQVLFTGNVDMNKVVGSISLFLLLGLMWTVAYLIILEFMPNAFTGVNAVPWGENFSHMAYFSFVTLTTLGYGDVSPLTPFSEVIVYLEAIAGVFYMAIVVSSLVSSSISNQGK
ncbi:potassium channel family protein [Vibrio rumoiensis]|uniref:Transporter n=1 Tax=Vibrio rumoiensis 1S-45 TaxID=1188252 RepID=A0A1E5E5H0_9VIBR|nr:potassium channel family protein [Vibrio rumoiensis]OEF28648.1 transporter [Vibrio rumoiensis 1S-45]